MTDQSEFWASSDVYSRPETTSTWGSRPISEVPCKRGMGSVCVRNKCFCSRCITFNVRECASYCVGVELDSSSNSWVRDPASCKEWIGYETERRKLMGWLLTPYKVFRELVRDTANPLSGFSRKSNRKKSSGVRSSDCRSRSFTTDKSKRVCRIWEISRRQC